MSCLRGSLRPVVLVLLSLILLVSAAGTGLAENDPWNCPDCGRTGNTGNYCGGCGHPAPWMEEEAGGEPEQGGPLPSSVKVGDIVAFGAYPQTAGGKDSTPVEWLVLEVRGGEALLISRYGLDGKPYNTEMANVSWEACSLRAWLNGEFLDRAFSQEEQAGIRLTEVDNSASQGYGGDRTPGGNNTQDRIFLLSCAEARRYFRITENNNAIAVTANMASRAAPTAYAVSAGAVAYSGVKTADGDMPGMWWLRSPVGNSGYAACVQDDGSIVNHGVDMKILCVRPALWVDIDSVSR